MKTALVTGHAGFVGRHMAKALVADGWYVVGVDSATPVANGTERFQVAVDHRMDCRHYFRQFNMPFDLVVHCAAVVGGRTMIDGEPLLLAAEDLSIDAELFRWALRARPGRIVYFSSSAAYPRHLQRRFHYEALTEMTIPSYDHQYFGVPDATYGWVKLTGERLAAEANRVGIPVHVFRPFSGYGADQALDYPFPAIIRRALQRQGEHNYTGAEPFTVWGDPGSARDWVHIDDVVDCVLAHLDADARGPVNICTGIATTFADLAANVFDAIGLARPPIAGDLTKPAGVFWRVGDPTLMRQVFTPRITLSEGIERALGGLPRAA